MTLFPGNHSTLIDTKALRPPSDRPRAHVMAAERMHGYDTTVPVLAKGKTDIARPWVYVRDDRPFGGTAPPAAIFYYSRDRGGVHPQAHLAAYASILQRTLMAVTPSSTKPIEAPAWFCKQDAGRMRAANSLCWPMLKRLRDAAHRRRAKR